MESTFFQLNQVYLLCGSQLSLAGFHLLSSKDRHCPGLILNRCQL